MHICKYRKGLIFLTHSKRVNKNRRCIGVYCYCEINPWLKYYGGYTICVDCDLRKDEWANLQCSHPRQRTLSWCETIGKRFHYYKSVVCHVLSVFRARMIEQNNSPVRNPVNSFPVGTLLKKCHHYIALKKSYQQALHMYCVITQYPKP